MVTVATHTTLEFAAGTGTGIVVVKRRDLVEVARQRTEAEARWLAAASRREGVVRLRLASIDRCRIETHQAGTATLRTRSLAPAGAASVLATVAADLAGLHRHGLVHGNLSPDHVILTGTGPLLCSPSGTADDPADDIAGLAEMVTTLAAAWDRPASPAPLGLRFRSPTARTCQAWLDLADRLRHDRHRMSAGRASGLLAELGRARGRRRTRWWFVT